MSEPTRSSSKGLPQPLTAAIALLAAFILAIRGANLLYPPGHNSSGWLWFLLAAITAAFAFAGFQRREGEVLPAARPACFQPARRVGWALVLVGAGIVMALATMIGLSTTGNHQLFRWTWLLALALLLGGSFLFGALGSGTLAPWRAKAPADRKINWLEVGGLLLLVALALILRIYRLNDMPPGIFIDETNAALDALQIMEGRQDSPFGTGWFETPTMYAYYLVALFRVLGTSLVALKAASVIPSVLSVAALYPLARLMFGIPAAFAATFLLATNRWHMTMSRWGWNEVAPLLFMIAALFFLLRAVRDRRASDYALAGLILGLGHYTYLASRLVVLVLVLYLIYRALFERDFLRRNWRGLALSAILYLVAFGPLLMTYVQDPFTFNNRSQQVSILHDMTTFFQEQGGPTPGAAATVLSVFGFPREISLQPLQESLFRHLEMFHVSGDLNPRHNLPGEPMLDPVTGALMILGLGFAAYQVFRPCPVSDAEKRTAVPGISGGHRYTLLILWLFVPLLGGILTRLDEAPQAYRTLPVVGAVVLLAAVAAVRSVDVFGWGLRSMVGSSWSRWARAVPAVLMGALLLWAGVVNARLFFSVQASDGRVWQAFSPVETAVAAEVAGKMDDHSLYLSPRLYNFSPLQFLSYRSPDRGGGGLREPAYQLAEPAIDLPLSDPFGQDALFLLDTYYRDVPELFRATYPGARFELVEGPGGQPLYLSVTVPGDEILALQGLQAAYTLDSDQSPVTEPYQGAPQFRWPADLAGQATASATASWSGSLKTPDYVGYAFQISGPGLLFLDGQLWSEPRFLGKGLHSIEIRQIEPGSDIDILLSWTAPKQGSGPVPPNLFFRAVPPEQGLQSSTYRGELWEGEPVFSRVDPVLLFAWPEDEPWNAPFSVRWQGTLIATQEGSYRLQLRADDGVRLWLDEKIVAEGVTPDTVNMIDVAVPLTAGPHAIRIDYFQRGGGKALEFWWQPPGEALKPVPPGAMVPAQQ